MTSNKEGILFVTKKQEIISHPAFAMKIADRNLHKLNTSMN